MTAPCFQVGDRVRVRSTHLIVCPGAPGTVQAIFGSIRIYAIQFDGYRTPHLMLGEDLERSDETLKADRERTA